MYFIARRGPDCVCVVVWGGGGGGVGRGSESGGGFDPGARKEGQEAEKRP